MAGRKFVLIGGAGLIGSHTLERLLEQDVGEVVIYDNFSRGTIANLSTALLDSRVVLQEHGGDILHTDVLSAALAGADGVFHFAAMWLLHCEQFHKTAFEVNIQGTYNVLHACARQSVKRIVFSSSASVYGESDVLPIPESHRLESNSFYGATKISCEALLRSFNSQFDLGYAALRYMNVFGPRQDYRGAYVAVIMKMLDSIDDDREITIFGNGSETYDFISVLDCARANVLAMQSSMKAATYNVGTGVGTSLLELAKMLKEITGSQVPVRFCKSTASSTVK
ncbi:NAD-dependent epimerase/dehydratase family protein, partial [Luminiphilus sp.]|nr:NAD-dependent epimerase/dehydratase family protein [Luminiphilus sp.]